MCNLGQYKQSSSCRVFQEGVTMRDGTKAGILSKAVLTTLVIKSATHVRYQIFKRLTDFRLQPTALKKNSRGNFNF